MEQFFNDIKTSHELRHEGISPSTVRRRCAQGRLIRIMPNAYVDAHQWVQWDEETRVKARHASFIKTHQHYVLSHVSAALWWSAPLLRLPRKIWVSHPAPTVRSRPQVHVSRGREDICAKSTFHRGAFVTSPLQTVLDCAMTLPCLDALCVADYFLNRGLVSTKEVREGISLLKGKGVCTARAVAALMSDKSESPAETIARYRIVTWGFTPPQEQVSIRVGSSLYRPDFLWEEFRVIVEVDGNVKYDGSHGNPVQVIRREKQRQRDLEQLGYRVLRVTWDDIMRSPENFRALLINAGVR
ncbi:hypothetical protein A7979_05630 [Rothia nasimurium]|uniref:DUF559 domain-containing protein n=1 Tax=Rothia nasimurium TaxID=85336 RepID=A0A1Y1RND5_9MICC|nr:DUF559 domain-containing protein [Rothia nasimurium]ORC16084.1 hypothetical protein A7979_05630 [Rothia nasimurium]